MPRFEPAFATALQQARSLQDACMEMIRQGQWQALTQQAPAYNALIRELMHSSHALPLDVRPRAALALLDLSARHRRMMGLLKGHMARITEDRSELRDGMHMLAAQRRLVAAHANQELA